MSREDKSDFRIRAELLANMEDIERETADIYCSGEPVDLKKKVPVDNRFDYVEQDGKIISVPKGTSDNK